MVGHLLQDFGVLAVSVDMERDVRPRISADCGVFAHGVPAVLDQQGVIDVIRRGEVVHRQPSFVEDLGL